LLSDKTGYSRSYLKQFLVSLLGGRAAEEIVFGELTTGAGNDLERTTDIAKKMVCSWGMSDVIGPMTIGKDHGEVYLGKELVSRDSYSDETTRMVDAEIRSLISESYQKALEILRSQRELLDVLAKDLQEKETLGTEEIFQIILKVVSDEDKSMVEAKYAKAKELRFEHISDSMEDVENQDIQVSDTEVTSQEGDDREPQ
jgi:cell division protease FtsH